MEITSPVQSDKETTYDLAWTTAEHGPPATRFELVVRKRFPDGRLGTAYTRTSPSTIRLFRFSGLEPGSTYEGTMVAVNELGRSEVTPFTFVTSHSVGASDRESAG